MKYLLILYMAIATFSVTAQQQFPELTGKKLSGEQITLPEGVNDKISIIGMAYSKKSEHMLKTWYTPMYDKFVLQKGIFDFQYDVNMLFVPMYTGTKKVAHNVSMKKMTESNRKDLYPHLLFYKGSLEPYVSELKMENKALPYLFVVDQEGNILYQTQGFYSEKQMERIEEILDAQLD